MRFLFLFLLRILSFKVSALKKLKTQKKTLAKPTMLQLVWGQASQGPQDSDMNSKALLQLPSVCPQKLVQRKFLVFLMTVRAQSSKFWRGRMVLNTKEGKTA